MLAQRGTLEKKMQARVPRGDGLERRAETASGREKQMGGRRGSTSRRRARKREEEKKERGRNYGRVLSHLPNERPDAAKGEKGRRQGKERRSDEATKDTRQEQSRLGREREGGGKRRRKRRGRRRWKRRGG